MGCDIHLRVEYSYDGERWYAVKDPIFSSSYYNEERPITFYNHPYTSTPCKSRNYRLFSKLADVRNSNTSSLFASLFGGSPTLHRDSIEPLAQPRGVPADASTAWKKYVRRWGGDLHSTSYFTLRELEQALKEGKLTDTLTERGWVKLRDYINFRKTGETPSSWAGGVGGAGVSNLSMAAAEAMSMSIAQLEELNAGEIDEPIRGTYVEAAWVYTHDTTNSYSQLLRLMEEMRERLVEPMQNLNEDRVRIVFGFDN